MDVLVDSAAADDSPVDSSILGEVALIADSTDLVLDVLIDEYAEKADRSAGLISLEPLVLGTVTKPLAEPEV